MTHKKDGFDGQRAITIPAEVINNWLKKNPAFNSFYITDLGYYPKARFHHRKRTDGISQHILIYCIEGQGKFLTNNTYTYVNAGDYVILPAKHKHEYEASLLNPWTIYWCHFNGHQANHIVNTLLISHDIHKSSVGFSDERLNLFNRIYQLLEKGYGFDNINYVNMVLPYFLASFIYNDKFNAPILVNANLLIDKTIEFMQKNLDKPLTLADFATQINFSASHFSAIFKNKTGYAPLAYFNHLKMQKACQYLHFTTLRANEIAFKIGIQDAHYFSRLFKKIMGISPKAYRENKTIVKINSDLQKDDSFL